MSDTAGEPRRIIPALGPYCDSAREFVWLMIRLTAGGFLLIHGLQKLFNQTLAVWAANVLARRGIEPAIPLAYCVWFLETVGAVCIMLGLFTRIFAAMVFVQFLVIVFVAHWGGGFAGFPWNRATGILRSGVSSSSQSSSAAAGLIRSTVSLDESSDAANAPAIQGNAQMNDGRGGCHAAAAGLIQTLLSWNAAPP